MMSVKQESDQHLSVGQQQQQQQQQVSNLSVEERRQSTITPILPLLTISDDTDEAENYAGQDTNEDIFLGPKNFNNSIRNGHSSFGEVAASVGFDAHGGGLFFGRNYEIGGWTLFRLRNIYFFL